MKKEWSGGVMEYWSDDKENRRFWSDGFAVLQYSLTPDLQLKLFDHGIRNL